VVAKNTDTYIHMIDHQGPRRPLRPEILYYFQSIMLSDRLLAGPP